MSAKRPQSSQLDKSLSVLASAITDGNTYRLGPHADETNPDLFSGGPVTGGSLTLTFMDGISAADQAKITADEAPLTLSLSVDFLDADGETIKSDAVLTAPTTANGETPGRVGKLDLPTDIEIGNAKITVADGANGFDSLYINWVR